MIILTGAGRPMHRSLSLHYHVNLSGAYEEGRTGGVPPALPPKGSERLETGHGGPDRRAERVDRDTGIIAWSRTGYD